MAFNFFNNYDRQVSKLFKSINPKTAPLMFPGGKEQFKDILFSMDKLIEGDKPLKELLKVYINTCSRLLTGMTKDHIPRSLINKHPGTITQENVYRIISYVMINMKNPSFVIKTDEDIAAIDSMADYQIESNLMRINNTKEHKNLENTEQYGLIPQEPIYTNDVKGSNNYLSRLRTEYGVKLKSQRIMSLSIDSVNGLVDKYDLFLPSGELYKTIYINMYSQENSAHAPKGFILIPEANDTKMD